MRIEGLIHVADETELLIIPAKTIERAISIGKYFLVYAQYAHSIMGNDKSLKLAKAVLEKIKKTRVERIKRSDKYTRATIKKAQEHNEREKSTYFNQDIVLERTNMNVHFKRADEDYEDIFDEMERDKIISTRGLKRMPRYLVS